MISAQQRIIMPATNSGYGIGEQAKPAPRTHRCV